MERRVAWFDVETTSLAGDDPRTLLLELAIVITDMLVREIASITITIRYTEDDLAAARWDPIALEMHKANGLLVDVVSDKAVPLEEARQKLLRFLAEHTGTDVATPPDCPGHGSMLESAPLWGGCSPWLDRTIIRRVMPELYERVHYRSWDATTLRSVLETWAGETMPSRPKGHRALLDVRYAIDVALMAKEHLKAHATSAA